MENFCKSEQAMESKPPDPRSPRRQNIKIRLDCLGDKKCRDKATEMIFGFRGVLYVEVEGENKLSVVVEGIDPVGLVEMLRKELGFAKLLSVEDADFKEKQPIRQESEPEPEHAEEKKKVLKVVPKEEEKWNVHEIIAIADLSSLLPQSPRCPFLYKLSLEGSHALMALPCSFFEHMPLLQELNLSGTSIKSLPQSISKLNLLKMLILRNCELLMELPPQVGELYNLELLDLDQTYIFYLPNDVGKLSKLKILRLCFYEFVNCVGVPNTALIQPGIISALSELTELSIDVDPDDERWNALAEVVLKEACSLESLECLKMFLPNIEALEKCLPPCSSSSTSPSSSNYYPFTRFSLTTGQHKQRTVSRVPKKLEACFREWDNCFKFVRGKGIPSEIKRLLRHSTALYLDRHTTVNSLSDFEIQNMQELEFCLLAECNTMQYILDGDDEFHEEQTEVVKDEKKDFIMSGTVGSHSGRQAQTHVLPHLRYLHVFYLKNLASIWKTPTTSNHQQYLSSLKFLTLHKCPKLSVIFSPCVLAGFIWLEVLIVEDCPEVTSIVWPACDKNSSSDCFLPRLETIWLVFLPKLTSVSGGFHIAPKLEKIGFFYCPKVESLSPRELSSENLKMIRGESDWWEGLKWIDAEWGKKRLDYLRTIFFPILKERDVMTQMQDMLKYVKREKRKTAKMHRATKRMQPTPLWKKLKELKEKELNELKEKLARMREETNRSREELILLEAEVEAKEAELAMLKEEHQRSLAELIILDAVVSDIVFLAGDDGDE